MGFPLSEAGELENIDIATEMVEKGEIDFIGLARTIMVQPNFVEGLIRKIEMQNDRKVEV
ncbi:hypothetical protein [Bacillus sp. T3]|uniref:hypothetical protein n=1 Tax=Bacillus sp. T3 TaxID=467262 RepID=UPI0029815272|nr:hypothetical protein [Bacillus sp. T3]